MTRAKTFATTGVAALLLTLSMSVSAQQIDTHDKTFITFSGAVELPGMTLPAGTYVFRLADTGGTRNVIQVLSKDEMTMLGQWLYVSTERRDVTDDTVVTFKETREGTTPAIQYWYYPGEGIGKEFIYPKDQAARIAARTGAAVKTAEGDLNPQIAGATTADSTVSEPAESTSASARVETPAPAAEPAPQPSGTESTAVGTSGIQSPNATDRNAQLQPESTSTYNATELPRTASPLPLSGLLGFFSIVGAAGLRRFRRE